MIVRHWNTRPLTSWFPWLAVLLLFSRSTSAQGQRSDWPQFRGPGGSGISAATGVPVKWGPKENLLWKTELPGTGTSSPILVGERIYLTCYQGRGEELQRQLVCLDLAGKVLWTKEVKSKLPEQDRIREDHGYASSTPASDGKNVYVFFGKSGAFAFDLEGKLLWEADVGSKLNGWGSAASPVLYRDLVIINASVESESMAALDKTTGEEKWRAKGIRESWNTPILVPVEGGKTELVVAIVRKILGFDPDSGEQIWSCDTAINSYMAPSLVAHQGVVYCVGGRSGGSLAVRAGGRGDVTKTHRVWTSRKFSNVTSPIFHDRHLYWMNDNLGIAYCAKADTGEIVYEERVARADQVYASPVLAGGNIYYVSRSGRTFVVPARPKYELMATNHIGDRVVHDASPAVGPGRIYLRAARFLYCLENGSGRFCVSGCRCF